MNRATRKRTNEQIAREYEVLLEIEEKESKKRQRKSRVKCKECGTTHGIKRLCPNGCDRNAVDLKENFPEGGQSREIAAEKLNTGWSGRTAETFDAGHCVELF